ncbi:MAG: hypothetical protein M1834_006054 [Cirrosporium novae-zelandiae]|nr:MAG: hypothetical protein M1834_006054 [Cirrosporium novae-zelandiae]
MSNPGNVIGGYKASIHNPNTSKEAKDHSRQVLDEEFGIHVDNKNPVNVAGGLKAAISNPNVSNEAKESAEQRLKAMDR